MPESLLAELAKGGLLAICLAISCVFIWRLVRDLKEAQEARVRDAQAVVERVLSLANAQHETARTLGSELVKNTAAQATLAQSMRDLEDEVRRHRPYDGGTPHEPRRSGR